MPSALRQYAALAVLLLAAFIVQAGNTAFLYRILRHGKDVPAELVNMVAGTRTIASGPFRGDQILAIDGRPFNAGHELHDAAMARHPGETVRLTLSEPTGAAIEREISVPPAPDFSLTILALNLAVPFAAIVLGFAVAIIRPRDWKAWIVLCLMMGFTESVRTTWWRGPYPDFPLLWTAAWRTIFPVALMYFGIYFPTRSTRDRKWPWIKYIFVVFFAGSYAVYEAILEIWRHDISLAQSFHWMVPTLISLRPIVLLVANLGFFANLRRKRAAETSPDGRRRLNILRVGSAIAVGPFVLLEAWAVITGSPLFGNIPIELTAPALLLLTFFPLVLFYVIVVERAMDLTFVIRSGIKYALVRSGLLTVRAVVIGIAFYVFYRAVSQQSLSTSGWAQLAGVGLVLFVLRRGPAERASNWIDRKFFREAYNAEHVLADLATEVGRYLESKPLLELVAARIGETLHVADIVILLRTGDTFTTTYTTRQGGTDGHRRLQQHREESRIHPRPTAHLFR